MDYTRDESAIFTESKGQRQVNTAVTLTIINWYRLHYYEAQIMLRLSKLTEVVDPCSQPGINFQGTPYYIIKVRPTIMKVKADFQ